MQNTAEKIEDLNPRPVISVIIPNLNGIKYLERCLNSLQSQSFKDFEMILVDDGSTDSSIEFIKKNYSWVKIIEHKVIKGFSVAVNDGIKVSKGKYIVLLNNDTLVDKLWLEKLYNTARKNPTAGFFASKMYFFGRDKLINAVGDAMGIDGLAWNLGYYQKDEEKYFLPKKVFGACAGAALYRREMLDEIGFFDEDFIMVYEDTDLSFRAQLMGYECIFVPKAIVYHVQFGTLAPTSERGVFYRSANSLNTLIKNMPLKLFLKYFYKIYRGQVSQIKELSTSFSLSKHVLKGKLRALKMLPNMLKKREKIQRSKRATDEYIRNLLLSEL